MLADKKNCSGCAACSAVCPVNAIEMMEDEEHFHYPFINNEKCISCKKCEHICNVPSMFNSASIGYAAQNLDLNALAESTSGGIVSSFCEKMIAEGSVIYAATYSVERGGYWIGIDSNDQVGVIRGSKYLQIELTNTDYEYIRKELKSRKVLFIGTPCQVNGIKKVFSGAMSENLYLIDIICGGVISSIIETLFRRYLEKNGKRLVYRRFRSKRDGVWERVYHSEYRFEDGSSYSFRGGEDIYNRLYMSERLHRESCYNCNFATENRVGDVTIGDCWGIEKEDFQFPNVEKGVSLVLVNSSKGKEMFESLSNIRMVKLSNQEPVRANKPLHECTKRHTMRNYSYRLFSVLPFRLAEGIVCYRYHIKKLLRR